MLIANIAPGKLWLAGIDGFISCITDRLSVAQSLALAESMAKWPAPPPLELYHDGTATILRDSSIKAWWNIPPQWKQG
eukprot:1017209-Amphidinium_carterae.1